MARERFSPDEFDKLPDGSPKGVHRRVPRPWTRVVVFLTVVLGFLGLAWGGARLYLIADDVSWLNWIRDLPFFQDSKPIVTPSPTLTVTPSPSPSPSPTPTYELILGASVTVYNDSGIGGLAGEVRTYILDETDFTSISTANWNGASFSANTVRFGSEEYQDSARYLADLLGIALTSFVPVEGTDIAIILVSDPIPEPSPTPTPSPTSSP